MFPHNVRTMAQTTPATLALKQLGIRFELHSYSYDPNAERVGLQARGRHAAFAHVGKAARGEK